ncbi:ArdC-like ssDNA-binding domain-containing protein [Rathayibacter soli]|uniref:ArdC-like ssDNA-binding domain-containing protein n=1 Tax=Rathayibacter soli TaxID=3144168 RepID=UPI0027E4DC56|nr:ArdC-like ssDNA-binding domain-containing protein [Glaciibacter superstes]
MAANEESRTAREAKLEVLHERLAGAVEALVSGEDWKRALEFAARFRARSFNNTLLIWTQHLDAFEKGRVPEPSPSYVAGFKQWQTLGRQISAGQAGYMILAPVTGRFATATPQDGQSWRRLGRFEKPRPGETVRSRMVGAKPAYVWDLSQTTGDVLPETPRPNLLQGEAPEGLWDGLAALVAAEGFALLRVPHEGMIGGANGLTDYLARTVAVRENMDLAAQVKTLAHELAHVRMHGPGNEDAVVHRGIGEVEADSVALMVGAAHGMDTSSYTVPYVSGWAATVEGKTPVEVVQATGERVRKTAAAILDALPTVQLGNGDPPGLVRDTPTTQRTGRESVLAEPVAESERRRPSEPAARSL